MEDYRPNSHRSKEEQKNVPAERKVEKVVTGKVRTKKKNEMTKLKDVFISEDAGNVKSYIFMDVLVPTIKKAISDIVRDGVDMILYGSAGNGKRKASSDKVSYRDYYGRERDRRSDRDSRGGTRFDYEDLVFDTRGEAEAVREQMDDVIDHYGFVTVADMYDMADLTAPYTASKYGWTNIRSAEPVRVRDGYILKLPKCMPID